MPAENRKYCAWTVREKYAPGHAADAASAAGPANGDVRAL